MADAHATIGTIAVMTRKRFAAKLLFQYRVGHHSNGSKYRICEERIVALARATAAAAYTEAMKIGKKAECGYSNDERIPVFVEFVGILDLIDLGPECEANEVWYDIKTMLMPMERRRKLVPKRADLSAFKPMRRR